MFRFVFYLYILRFSITLNIGLVHDQMLQKAGTYIHLLAKVNHFLKSMQIHSPQMCGKRQSWFGGVLLGWV